MTLMLDRLTWANSEGAGSVLNQIQNPKARRRVVQTVKKAAQFDDTIAELTFWGWLRQTGFDAELREDDGLPDIYVHGSTPFWGRSEAC
jgi:hypothetical protein